VRCCRRGLVCHLLHVFEGDDVSSAGEVT
jgi:hypothetical protein